MGRSLRCRLVDGVPVVRYFKPQGIPMTELDEVVLGIDEFEALRLADLEGLYHEDAARQMGVSRQTFGRIVGNARHKVAEALASGKALRIDGDEFRLPEWCRLRCRTCGSPMPGPRHAGAESCPQCGGAAGRREGREASVGGRRPDS